MFVLNGIKWGSPTVGTPSGEIRWDEDLSGLTPASGSTTADLVASLRAAFISWENVAALTFSEVSSAIDVNIGYASFSTDGDVRNDGAVATASWSGGNFYSEPANVRIEFNSDEIWTPFDDSNPFTVDFNAVALHEIGHVIGHDHINDSTQIMNPVISVDELGDFDIAGMQELYGLDDDDEPVDVDTSGGSFDSGGDGGGGGGAGILLGLLALIAGLFTGGLGAAGVLAAGRVTQDEPHAEDDHDDHEHDDHDHQPSADGETFHAAFYLPTIPFDEFPQVVAEPEDEDGDLYLF